MRGHRMPAEPVNWAVLGNELFRRRPLADRVNKLELASGSQTIALSSVSRAVGARLSEINGSAWGHRPV